MVKRATSGSALVLTRSRLTSIQSLTFAAQLGVDVVSLAVQHSETVKLQHGRLRRRIGSFDRTPHNRIDVVVQQYALH